MQMTEEEYRAEVEKRRAAGDFVEDDGGIGYHDDGEELWHRGDERGGKLTTVFTMNNTVEEDKTSLSLDAVNLYSITLVDPTLISIVSYLLLPFALP